MINLVVKAFLYRTEFDAFKKDIKSVKEHSNLLKELTLWRKRGPIGKLHNTVIFICRTPQRRERFEKIKSFTSSEGEDFDHLRLVINNATRWNSLYSMVDRALNLRERIDRFCYENAGEMHGNSTGKKGRNDANAQYLLKNDALNNDD